MVGQENVSALSIVFMAISTFLSVIVPISVIIFLGVKKRLNWKAMLFGALLFVVFVFILESLMHLLVLGSDPTQNAIYKNPILYMIYGGFAAGIFEETARLLGFKFMIRVRDHESLDTGISYGLGHGGIEAILLGGLTSIGNIVTSIMWNGGTLKGLTSTMNEQQLANFNAGIHSLITLPSATFLMTGVERLTALTLQVALSLFVFKAVVDRKWLYFLYAILIHAGVDMLAVLVQRGYIKNLYLFEGLIILITVAVFIAALRINRRVKPTDQGIPEYAAADPEPAKQVTEEQEPIGQVTAKQMPEEQSLIGQVPEEQENTGKPE